jgi:hypothetical protein
MRRALIILAVAGAAVACASPGRRFPAQPMGLPAGQDVSDRSADGWPTRISKGSSQVPNDDAIAPFGRAIESSGFPRVV